MKNLLVKVVSAAVILPIVLAADGPMVPDYEVHLLLDPTVVLGSDFKLTPTVLSTFAMPTTVTKINVQYIDTVSEDLYNNGWSCRIRNIENESGFDLTYKWRLPVNNGDINGALNTAFSYGWNSGQGNYNAQIDWLYTSQTLSIQRDYTASSKGYSGTDDPDENDSRSMLESNAPSMFNDWVSDNWGTDLLESGVIYGPVLTKRSIGTWNGVELDIEVWPIENSSGTGIEYIVEASFKTDNYTFASTGRDQLITLLQNESWFLAESLSKEDLVMENYHPTS
ncbi:hypothetical protein TASIC1_0011002100 [Trichoderma asperellum]|uniref:Uncharacterized protein n=1 Tax=Trichoderma asperellum TaxID=101201 RepID=A0A6V8R0U1_TRIAP|nr:hypothetical protein LI328DRAFT_164753 [Trichoderma asperelloides]GFP58654.1 hypothetical protein TASIC1_0011002100 [Trichoderma asperellum]